MGLVPKFSPSDVKRIMQQRVARIETAILQRLQFIGEKFIVNARNNGNYTDRTGNLRNSIGYVILRNGEEIHSSFPGTGEGRSKGVEIANDVADGFPRGYVLIVVAGMDYAAAVESRNKDVLTASSIQAEADLRNAMSKISEKIGRMQ